MFMHHKNTIYAEIYVTHKEVTIITTCHRSLKPRHHTPQLRATVINAAKNRKYIKYRQIDISIMKEPQNITLWGL